MVERNLGWRAGILGQEQIRVWSNTPSIDSVFIRPKLKELFERDPHRLWTMKE